MIDDLYIYLKLIDHWWHYHLRRIKNNFICNLIIIHICRNKFLYIMCCLNPHCAIRIVLCGIILYLRYHYHIETSIIHLNTLYLFFYQQWIYIFDTVSQPTNTMIYYSHNVICIWLILLTIVTIGNDLVQIQESFVISLNEPSNSLQDLYFWVRCYAVHT